MRVGALDIMSFNVEVITKPTELDENQQIEDYTKLPKSLRVTPNRFDQAARKQKCVAFTVYVILLTVIFQKLCQLNL